MLTATTSTGSHSVRRRVIAGRYFAWATPPAPRMGEAERRARRGLLVELDTIDVVSLEERPPVEVGIEPAHGSLPELGRLVSAGEQRPAEDRLLLHEVEVTRHERMPEKLGFLELDP